MSTPDTVFHTDITRKAVGDWLGGKFPRVVRCPVCGAPAAIVGVSKRGTRDLTRYAHHLTIRNNVTTDYNPQLDDAAVHEHEAAPEKKQARR